MEYYLKVKGAVEAKIYTAYIWHEEKKEGRGEQFLKDARECYKKLIDNPYIGSKRNKLYRKIYFTNFPYYFTYGINKNKITIIAFKHKSQR
jgi:plasmid stabilization system protein ParE